MFSVYLQRDCNRCVAQFCQDVVAELFSECPPFSLSSKVSEHQKEIIIIKKKKTFLCANPTPLSSLNVYITGLWCSSWQIETFSGFFASITGRAAEGNGRSAKSFRQTGFLSPTKGINIWNPLRTQDEIDHNWGHFKYKMEHSEEQPAMMESSVPLTVPLCPLHLQPSPSYSPTCCWQYIMYLSYVITRIINII